jgi:hypothetical protein
MKYLVINYQIMNSGTTANSSFEYPTLKEALSAYHSTLASNYISEALSAFAVTILDEHGMTVKTECYDPRTPVIEEG